MSANKNRTLFWIITAIVVTGSTIAFFRIRGIQVTQSGFSYVSSKGLTNVKLKSGEDAYQLTKGDLIYLFYNNNRVIVLNKGVEEKRGSYNAEKIVWNDGTVIKLNSIM